MIVFGSFLIILSGIMTGNNVYLDINAGESSQDIINKLSQFYQTSSTQDESVREYYENADNEMAYVNIEDNSYIGILSIPRYNLELPVMKEWSYDRLQISPCLYSGTVYKHNMVIAAHNYYSHFGNISGLNKGDEVIFKSIDNIVVEYTVSQVDTLDPYAVEEMCNSKYDLTLFTCTWGGQRRVTVRCLAK